MAGWLRLSTISRKAEPQSLSRQRPNFKRMVLRNGACSQSRVDLYRSEYWLLDSLSPERRLACGEASGFGFKSGPPAFSPSLKNRISQAPNFHLGLETHTLHCTALPVDWRRPMARHRDFQGSLPVASRSLPPDPAARPRWLGHFPSPRTSLFVNGRSPRWVWTAPSCRKQVRPAILPSHRFSCLTGKGGG